MIKPSQQRRNSKHIEKERTKIHSQYGAEASWVDVSIAAAASNASI